jgi:NAD(P)-dependent dehydrogenase (short-subunit alcohol dehydrogenase family)
MNIDNKVILITGASRGIGNYVFNRYLQQNKNVVGFYHNTVPLENIDRFYKMDVRNYIEVESVIQKLQLENIVLINCAGINYNAFLHKSDPEKWKDVILTNLVGTYNVIRAVLPLMRQQRYGRIINFNSVVAFTPTMGTTAYASSKSGLSGLTLSANKENESLNVTINDIVLGYTTLGMIRDVPDELLKDIKLIQPEEVFNTVESLIENSTGGSIQLTGGIKV